jgi:hypothetical protein
MTQSAASISLSPPAFNEMARAALLSDEAQVLEDHVKAMLMKAITQTGMGVEAWKANAPEREKYGNSVTFARGTGFYATDALTEGRYFVTTRMSIVQTRPEVQMSFSISAMHKNAFTSTVRITELHRTWPKGTPAEQLQAEILSTLAQGPAVFASVEQFDDFARQISIELMP